MIKGIVLAGGYGTRLYPLTKCFSKQLLPIYNKPMIYYSLSILMLAGIKDILLITNKGSLEHFKAILGQGEDFGLNIEYRCQEEPRGLAEAFIIGEDFIGHHNVCLVLGDNILWGQGLSEILSSAVARKNGATIFAYPVTNPSSYGIVNVDENDEVISIEEKPKNATSNLGVPGIYFYDNEVVAFSKSVKPSSRGELEITSINNMYLKRNSLKVEILGRGFAWFDAGTHETLLEASSFVHTIIKCQGFHIACLEEIGLRNGWIDKKHIEKIIQRNGNNEYRAYLIKVLEDN